MAYDEELAERIRALIGPEPGLSEQKMFGGLAFLVGGNMAIAASGQGGVLVRVDPEESAALADSTPASLFEMRGRQMAGWLRVGASDVATDEALSHWVERGVSFARSLPAKPSIAILRVSNDTSEHISGALENLLSSIETRLVPYHARNAASRGPELIQHLAAGRDLALTTDAGTPGVSDPAFTLIREALAAGLTTLAVTDHDTVAALDEVAQRCAGAGIRLARFNANIAVVDKRYFQGLPSPSGAAVMAGFIWVLVDFAFAPREHAWLAPVTWAVAVFAGVTMVSNVPFWSFKEVNWKKRVPLWVILACVVGLSVVASKPSLVLFALFLAYSVSGYVMWAMGHRVRPVLPEE